MQTIITAEDNYKQLDGWFVANSLETVMLVCGRSIEKQDINGYFKNVTDRLGVRIIRFMDFAPNPLYENVVEGVKKYRDEGCQGIIAVGGGSAMDVAKCIKLYSKMTGNGNEGGFLSQQIVANSVPFLAMPTTAGTGSEATRFAVIYYGGEKQSISDSSCIPETVLLDPGVLRTLPDYQKKATMCDALCHGIESFWSKNRTEKSKEYSREAIQGVLTYMDGYMANTEEGNAGMFHAAHVAGKAINITQTTAGHAMCYKITSLFKVAHGHAAILCDRVLFRWMAENTDRCMDAGYEANLKGVLDEIGQAMGCADGKAGAEKLVEIVEKLGLVVPAATEAQFELLKTSVNPVRLKNHPVALTEGTIDKLYHEILREA